MDVLHRFRAEQVTFPARYGSKSRSLMILGFKFVDSAIVPFGVIMPLNAANVGNAESYGFELAADWVWCESFCLRGSYSFLELFVQAPGARGRPAPNDNGHDQAELQTVALEREKSPFPCSFACVRSNTSYWR